MSRVSFFDPHCKSGVTCVTCVMHGQCDTRPTHHLSLRVPPLFAVTNYTAWQKTRVFEQPAQSIPHEVNGCKFNQQPFQRKSNILNITPPCP